MARQCDICGKGKVAGNRVSRSKSKSKRTFKPNIQKIRVLVDGQIKTLNVCTQCLRSGKVKRAP